MGWPFRRRKSNPVTETIALPTTDAPSNAWPSAFPADAGPPWTGRALVLPATPTPANAAALANVAAQAAQAVAGIELDFSPASLQQLDDILAKFRGPGSDAMAETIFVFGCYIGEVMVRHAGYVWVETPADLVQHLGKLTVYHSGKESHANPINKAFKRVDYGDPDNLPYFYHVFTTDNPLRENH